MANKYWVGGTGDLDGSTTTHISDTSGGADGATYPASGDTLIFDGASGGGVVTVTANQTISIIDGGAFTGTVHFGSYTINGSYINWGGTATRTFDPGSAIFNLAFGGSALRINDVTNLTITPNTATFNITGASAGVQVANVNLNGSSIVITGSGTHVLTGGSPNLICANLTITGTANKTDIFNLGGPLTCTGTFTANSNSGINRILVQSSTVGTARTITAATVVIGNIVDFQDIVGAGAATWTVAGTGATALGDCGGCSGITFPASVAQTWNGASGGNWSTNAWSTRVPLPQDSASLGVAFSASQTVVHDMPRLCRDYSWAGATGSPIASFASTPNTIYGSVNMTDVGTISGTQVLTLAGRG